MFIGHKFKENNSLKMVNFVKQMALIAIFLLESYAHAFPSLSSATGSKVQDHYLIQLEEPISK
jgi:hypothetical protein